jgi:hypothetical protein
MPLDRSSSGSIQNFAGKTLAAAQLSSGENMLAACREADMPRSTKAKLPKQSCFNRYWMVNDAYVVDNVLCFMFHGHFGFSGLTACLAVCQLLQTSHLGWRAATSAR